MELMCKGTPPPSPGCLPRTADACLALPPLQLAAHRDLQRAGGWSAEGSWTPAQYIADKMGGGHKLSQIKAPFVRKLILWKSSWSQWRLLDLKLFYRDFCA